MSHSDLPIYKLINDLNLKLNKKIAFSDLKQELTKKNENNEPFYQLNLKENEDLALIYHNEFQGKKENKTSNNPELEQSCRSLIMDKNKLQPIGSQYNRIIYNSEAKEILMKSDWNRVVIQKCYEGTIILVFNHNNVWYVTTRRCINSEEST